MTWRQSISSNTPLLGNDLIDLKDPDAAGIMQNRRFLQRVYSAEELEFITQSANPFESAWLFWGAKESAFKALRRTRNIVFSPRNINLSFDLANVVIDNTSLRLYYSANSNYIHTCCYRLPCEPLLAVAELASIKNPVAGTYSRESGLCRRFALEKVEKELGFTPEIRKVEESPRHPPRLFFQNRPLPHLLSLSHHGRYGALAFYRL